MVDMRLISRLLAILLALSFTRNAFAQPVNRQTCGVAPGHNLVVFVGRKVDVRAAASDAPAGLILLDNKFHARYRVLEVLCGDLDSGEVAFDVYDHYGSPAFAAFETVLLFLSRDGDRFFHQKYQYRDVYLTVDGSWAGCGDPYALDAGVQRRSARAQSLTFKDSVSFSVHGLSEREVQQRFPATFFDRRGDRVVCRAGVTLGTIFAIKRDGVLKARGLFR